MTGTVTLLLNGNGTDASTTFVDGALTPNTITAFGGAKISTAQSKFGGASMLFGGAGDYLETPVGIDPGASDFTIELWFRATVSSRQSLFCYDSDQSLGIEFNYSGTRNVNIWASSTGSSWDMIHADAGGAGIGTISVALNTWAHVAFTREGNVFRSFVNGVKDREITVAGSIYTAGRKVRIGRWGNGGFDFNGNIDDLRVTVGSALYTADFTPPTSESTYLLSYATLTCPAPLLLAGSMFSANASITGPGPAAVGYGGANTALACPSPIASGHFAGEFAPFTAPAPTLFSTGRSSLGDNSFVYTAPRATLGAFGGATAKLRPPSPTLSITATVVNFGAAALEAPSATLSAAGTVSGTAYANLTFGSNLGAYDLIGYGGAIASITLTGSPTVQATGTTGSVGRASLSAPLFELTASGTARNYGSALLTAPSGRLGATARAWLMAPSATLTAIGSAVVVATYEAYAVNLNHTPKRGVEPVDETTHYTNFPFTHVVRYKNSYFGANTTGLYLLEGTTDDGTDISYALKTTTSDLDSPNQKTVASAYFSGRLGPEATVTLYAGEGAGVPYAYNTVRGALAQNHREVFGKGIKNHRYYALGLSGSDVLELDNVELDVKQMNRRI